MTGEEIIQTVLLAGIIMMENGGETCRAEDTVSRMAISLGCTQSSVFAVPSGLFVTIVLEDGTRLTQIQRISSKGNDMTCIDKVNVISRQLADRSISPQDAYGRLLTLRVQKKKPLWRDLLGAGIAAGGFAILFGGGLADIAISVLTAVLVQLVLHTLFRSANSPFTQALLGSFLTTLLPLGFQAVTGIGMIETIVGAALMPFVPGIAMTNAVRDTMHGDLLSGVAHFAEAVLYACVIVGGALGANYLFGWLGGVL